MTYRVPACVNSTDRLAWQMLKILKGKQAQTDLGPDVGKVTG
jgi:phage gp16-like protein